MSFLPNDEERERGETTRNAGQTAYRVDFTRPILRLVLGTWFGAIAGMILATLAGRNTESGSKAMMALIAVAAVAGAIVALTRPGLYRCSDITCRAHVPGDAMVCPSCGSSFARTISPRQWRNVQAEDLDRNAAGMDFPDCDDCEPEHPCAAHGGRSD